MTLATITLGAVLLLAGAMPVAEPSLAEAKTLYASAAYEEALSMLTRLSEAGGAIAQPQIQAYRAFCFVALGRMPEAEGAFVELVRNSPTFDLPSEDASPRVEALFNQTRRNVLPALIRERYRAAKGNVDRKAFAIAEPQLVELQTLIREAATLDTKDESLADLGLLSEGFLALARANTANASSPQPSQPPGRGVDPAPSSSTRPAGPAAAADIYDASHTDVVGPSILRQVLPPVPTPLARSLAGRQGRLEITIEADGRVGKAVMTQSVSVVYDALVLEAVRQWRYTPAQRAGVPVRYLKAIAVQVQQ
jgi:TonB family protein